MKKVLGFLKQRWFVSLLGITALAVVLWFLGPYVSIADYAPLEGVLPRIIVILVIFLLWVLNIFRKRWVARRADRQIIDGMAETGPGEEVREAEQQSAEELGLIKERFDEALAVLGKKGWRGGSRSLYELPWYIIIGPPGSGKTTALVNSGLEFPLADRFGKEALRGVGGTRNCDWWFTNDAVLLDTAGRYTTQDSHAAVDSVAWEGFLGLLKKYRRRRPINGVLIAVSIADMMVQSEQERAMHVRSIKQRIQELHTHLGIAFPVYMMFTKCDLVAGFMEFFDDLSRDERARVWGMTFPVDDGKTSPVERFGGEFDALLGRLNDRLLARLSQERDLQRRSLIYGFPQQMSSLKHTLDEFLKGIFRSSRFEQPILLRGVYFTSGTQEGTPIDRLMGALSRTFGLDQRVLPSFGGHGRSYFITDGLSQVVFPEQDLVGINRKLERERIWLQHGAYVMSIVLAIGAALGWAASFTANKSYVEEVADSVGKYSELAAEPLAHGDDFAEMLPRLDSLRATTDFSRENAEGAPLYMRLGLFQGKALGEAANDAYVRELNTVLLPAIALRIEEQLRSGPRDTDFQYEALKLYLMLGDIERLDTELLKLWMGLDWQQQFATDPVKLGSLQEHLEHLVANRLEPVALNQQLIAEVRVALKQVPLAELIYGRLKRDYEVSDDMPFRLSDVLGRGGDKVFERAGGESLSAGFSGLFTYRGFYEVYQKQSRRLAEQVRSESWILGEQKGELSLAELKHLDKNMRDLYLADYIRMWDGLLRDLKITSMHNIQHATSVVEILSGPRSPMRNFLEAVERNTSLNRLPDGMQQLAEKAAQTATKSRLARLLQSGQQAVQATTPELPGAAVERHFEEINELVRSSSGAPAPIDGVIDLLSELYGYLGGLSADYGDGALGAAKGGGDGQQIMRRLQVEATRQPEPVKGWLQQLVSSSRSVTIGGARSQLNALWQSGVVPVCQRALYERYPFSKSSRQDVTLKDFGRIFGEGGLIDAFFEKHLAPFVDMTRRQWRWRPGARLGISNSVLRQFQNAARIRNAFFHDGGQRPSVHFTLKPLSLDSKAIQILLDIEGQKISYRHGPVRVTSVQWPASSSTNQVRIILEAYDKAQRSITEEGPWAWFRALDKAGIQDISADNVAASFRIDGLEAKYELRASSVVNPFLMTDELQRFRCPGSL